MSRRAGSRDPRGGSATPWPSRTAICLDCRTALGSTKDAHVAGHWIVSLTSEEERETLIAQVWGPWHTRRTVHLGWAITGGLAALSLLVGALVLLVTGFGGGLYLLAVLFSSSIASFFRMVLSRTQPEIERRVASEPLPGTKPPLCLAGSSALSGTIIAGDTAPAPISRLRCVAFGIELGSSRSELGDALRDGATRGFTLETLDGDLVIIPPGRIDVVGHGKLYDGGSEPVERYLATLDPLRRTSRDKDPFACAVAAELLFCVGDHIALHNPIKHQSFSPGPEGSYREAPRQIFTVEGTPCLERLP